MDAESNRPHETIGVGMVGAGAFARFCLDAFLAMPEVRVVGLMDIDDTRARAIAAAYGVRAFPDASSLIAEHDVQIVTVHTPPVFHAPIALHALEAGKHVFCEKPLALTLAEADQVIQAGIAGKKRIAVDYVLRSNPLAHSLWAIVRSGILGDLLHLSLENDAAAENLTADHWFWNPAISGGIWVEHGVLFFDLFQWLSGSAGVVCGSTHMARPTGEIDRVSALVNYGSVSATFTHTFKRANCFEHCEVRANLVCGNVTLHGWIPTSMTVEALIEPRQHQHLLELCPPGSQIVALDTPVPPVQRRGTPPERVRITHALKASKTAIYRTAIQNNLRQLVQAILNPSLSLQIGAEQARQSLETALEATRLSVGRLVAEPATGAPAETH